MPITQEPPYVHPFLKYTEVSIKGFEMAPKSVYDLAHNLLEEHGKNNSQLERLKGISIAYIFKKTKRRKAGKVAIGTAQTVSGK